MNFGNFEAERNSSGPGMHENSYVFYKSCNIYVKASGAKKEKPDVLKPIDYLGLALCCVFWRTGFWMCCKDKYNL